MHVHHCGSAPFVAQLTTGDGEFDLWAQLVRECAPNPAQDSAGASHGQVNSEVMADSVVSNASRAHEITPEYAEVDPEQREWKGDVESEAPSNDERGFNSGRNDDDESEAENRCVEGDVNTLDGNTFDGNTSAVGPPDYAESETHLDALNDVQEIASTDIEAGQGATSNPGQSTNDSTPQFDSDNMLDRMTMATGDEIDTGREVGADQILKRRREDSLENVGLAEERAEMPQAKRLRTGEAQF